MPTLRGEYQSSLHEGRCVKWSIVKTFLGGWATSDRVLDISMHQSCACVFGCHLCSDSWAHYQQCFRLWSIVRHVCGFLLFYPEGYGHALQFSQMLVFRDGCLAIYVAFKLYHSCKAKVKQSNRFLTADELLSLAYDIRHTIAA